MPNESDQDQPEPLRHAMIGPYAGDGSTMAARGSDWPAVFDRSSLTDPAGYVAEGGLADAVNVALALQQPLFVTGEPGTGKTQLASSIAYELLLPPPLRFQTKSDSSVRDLFYGYDALAHFHDVQFREQQPDVEHYVDYRSLGLAILLASNPTEADHYLPDDLKGSGPTRSVVLVDEIDKAPRDFANDMLDELERMTFTVKETGRTFSADPNLRPVVVITSNSEKALPDAFLRRCIFYHIPFPDRERLRSIVRRRIGDGVSDEDIDLIEHALDHFDDIRSMELRKAPATAELLEWLGVLHRHRIDPADPRPGDRDLLAVSYSILAKSREDLETIRRHLR